MGSSSHANIILSVPDLGADKEQGEFCFGKMKCYMESFWKIIFMFYIVELFPMNLITQSLIHGDLYNWFDF